MFRKTLIAAVAALTLTGAVVASTESAQAGWRGGAITAGVLGLAAGATFAATAANSGYYAPGYTPVYGYGCGYVQRPIYNAWGHFVGWRRVPAC